MAGGIIGREAELGALHAFLDARTADGSGALVLEGEAGIGKTALWLAGVAAAEARGFRVLSCRPTEAETRFSFAGLTDLLGATAGDVLPELPPIQRRALEAALLLSECEVDADERAVAAAFLEALRRLASDNPLCLAVDDVQWLDAASLASLGYALPRLDREPVGAFVAVRGTVPEWLRRAVPEDRLRTVAIGGLSLGATHQLLRARLDVTFPRPALTRIWQTSRGNAFFALELAGALQSRGGTLAPGEELPIPSDLDDLLRVRIDGLGPAALEVARAVAALADPTVTLVEAALGARFEQGLAEALGARILELDGQRLRFSHPLLGSAVAARQTPARRRSLNARLADLVPSAEERARHLALATAEPDGDTASILEEAARTALVRGAPAAAGELIEQALRLTPPSRPDDARRRVLSAAEIHSRAGDTARAVALLEKARSAAPPGNGRATVLAQLAGVQASPRDGVALYLEALSEAAGDDVLEASIQLRLAALMRLRDGFRQGLEHGRLAIEAASRVDDAALRCRALAAYGLMHFAAGRGIPSAEMQEALSLERSLAGWPLDGGPAFVYVHQLWWSADVDRARSLGQEIRSAVSARNDPMGQSAALWFLSFLEWRGGNWAQAERYAAETMSLQTQLGRLSPPGALPAAVIAAHRGRIDDARASAQGAIAHAEREEIRVSQSGHGWVLGFIELSLGNPAAALGQLRRAYELRNDFLLEPGMRLELGDLIEALIAVGELDEAGEVLATWQERAAALDRAWALAILARCRALLLASRGELENAFASFDDALAQHARSTDPFHHARTLLALGRTQRRAKRRAAARTTLGNALAIFERLGAPLWVEQAQDELARIGGRTRTDDLTPAEQRVADLVAQGLTNAEVAAALFLAERTVASHLTRVYAKLGVRSRTELAVALRG